MEHIISSLQSLHVCTTSYIRGAQDIGALRETHDNDRYNLLLSSWFDFHQHLEAPLAELTVGYVAQDAIKVKLGRKIIISLSELYEGAVKQAQQFASSEPWHWVRDPEELQPAPKQDTNSMEQVFIEKRLELTTREFIRMFSQQFGTSPASVRYHINKLIEKHGPTKRHPGKDHNPLSIRSRIRDWLASNDTEGMTRAQIVEAIVSATGAKHTSVNSIMSDFIKGGDVTPTASASKRAPSKRATLTVDGQQMSGRQWTIQYFTVNPSATREEFVEAAVNIGIKRVTAVTYFSTIKTREM